MKVFSRPTEVRTYTSGDIPFKRNVYFFTGEIKSFVTHITENPPRHLVHTVFWSGIGHKVQKMAIFGPK